MEIMDVFLVRHAIAVERSVALPDAERPLSERGIRRFAKAVRGMRRLGIELEQVFHSPWLRAVQTAEMLAPVTVGARLVTELLAADPDEGLIALAARSRVSQVAFVGHQPWMSELCSLLLVGKTRLADQLPFKKGGVAWLRGEPRPAGMELRAMLPPRCLRRIGRPRERDPL